MTIVVDLPTDLLHELKKRADLKGISVEDEILLILEEARRTPTSDGGSQEPSPQS